MFHHIVIICDHYRFGTNLGFQFGTRPLVFFAPKALSGPLMGAFGHVSAASRDRSYRVDGGTGFSGGSRG